MSKIELNNKDLKKQKGASLVEYGLLVALIAVVAIVAVTNLGTGVNQSFTEAANKI